MSFSMNDPVKKWEVQQYVAGSGWMNAIVSMEGDKAIGQQFDTRAEAIDELEALIRDLVKAKARGEINVVDVSNYQVVQEWPPAMYQEGYRFMAWSGLLKRRSEFILSYRYHNDTTWRYHLGLILGPAGSDVPPVYKHCKLNVRDGLQYVDFSTIDENEVALLEGGKL